MTNNNSTKLLSKAAIANSIDAPTDTIEVPEWKGTVRVKALPLGSAWFIQFVEGSAPSPEEIAQGVRQLPLREDQMADLFRELVAKQDYPSERERLARTAVAATILCAIDEDDEPIFGPDDVQMLRDGNLDAMRRISIAAHQLARPETLEEAKKDSGSSPESD